MSSWKNLRWLCCMIGFVALIALLWVCVPALVQARAAVTVPSPHGWSIEIVDAGLGGYEGSMALDRADHPHIIYSIYSSPNYDLKYAWYDGANWHTETVTNTGDVDPHPSLAVDSASRPHISYTDQYNYLRHAWRDGGTWYSEIVDVITMLYPSKAPLELDSADRPHIAYCTDGLKYASYDGAAWRIEIVDDPDCTQPALALGGAGQPHIIYREYDDAYGHGGLKYAWRDGTAWLIETVDSAGEASSLALDSAGQPRISYTTGNTFDGYNIKYARRDGTAWHVEIVSHLGTETPGGTALSLDEVGQPHIIYYLICPGVLRHTWYDGIVWQVETIDRGSCPTAGSLSLALDGAGRLHASYTPSYDTLKYASMVPFAIDKRVTPGGELHASHILTYTLALSSADPAVSLQLWDPLPVTVNYVTGSLTSPSGITPQAVYSPAARAILWAGQLPTGTVQTIRFQVAPDVFAIAASPAPVVVNEAWLTDAEGGGRVSAEAAVSFDFPHSTWDVDTIDSRGRSVSSAIDAQGRPHIGYFGNHDSATEYGELRHAWFDGTVWQIETVDSGRMVGEYSSLVLDAEDHLHVSYTSRSSLNGNPELKYAWRDGTAWHTQMVDNAINGATALAIGPGGQPHICYPGVDGLRHAWHDGSTWHFEVVENVGEACYSLALDSSGYPHSLYFDYTNYVLKYARYDGTAWQIETLPWGCPCGALILDRVDQPHISTCYEIIDPYVHTSLRYAWRDGMAWHVETVDAAMTLGRSVALALDDSGHPHIGYVNASWGEIRYARRSEVGWQTEMVTNQMVDWTNKVSLVVDDSGQPHIGYVDKVGLKYATKLPYLSLDKQAIPHHSVRNHDTVTYTLTISGPGLAVRLRDLLPMNVNYVTGSLSSSVAPPATYSPTARAILWQGTLPTGTVQTVRFQATLNITQVESLPMQVPIANTAWLIDGYNRSISSTAVVSVALPALSLDKQVSPGDPVHYDDTLTYTLVLSSADSSQGAHLWDPLPSTVEYVTGSLTGTVTPTAIYSPTARAIVWEGQLQPDAKQTIQFQVKPRPGGIGSLLLLPPIVNTAWLTSTEFGVGVSDTVTSHLTSGLFLHKYASPADGVRNGDSLTYTLVFSGAGQAVTLWDALPTRTHYISGSLTGTVMPPAVYDSNSHAIVWEGILTSTTQAVHFQVTPGATGTGSLLLSPPIVNTAWLLDSQTGLGVQATAIVNGYHLYLPLVLRNF